MRYRLLLSTFLITLLPGCPTNTTPCDPACSSDQVCMNGTCYAPVDSGTRDGGDANAALDAPDAITPLDTSVPTDATDANTALDARDANAPIDAVDTGSASTDAGPDVSTPIDTGPDVSTPTDGGSPGLPADLDLLLVVDNSNSMRDNQSGLMSQFSALVNSLTNPPCTSASNPAPHTCNAGDPSDVPTATPVGSLHVAVVDTDLGTPGSSVAGCASGDLGDDGVMNPIHYGAAISLHEPTNGMCPGQPPAPADFRPTDCTDPTQFPSFLSFTSAGSTQTQRDALVHDMRCNAGLYLCGCGLESPIESAFRGLIFHGAGPVHPPNSDTLNAGFLRDNAVLAIVMLTDEEDGSVQDCRFAMPGQPCTDKLDAYNAASTSWSTQDLNLRFYLYQPGGAQDPTWPMERYLDPSNPNVGFLSLKPGHPERIVFAAITGVPLPLPQITINGAPHTDWDTLLGRPSASAPDDFYQRDRSTAASGTQPGVNGPYSMQDQTINGCSPAVLAPACYREGSTYDPNLPCGSGIYRALPSRRVVELARRFDQAPVCNGTPCHNGYVSSICAASLGNAVQDIASLIQNRL